MKRFITILTSCFLALAAAAVAQEPQTQDQQQQTTQEQTGKGHGRKEAKQGANQQGGNQQGGHKQHAGRNATAPNNAAATSSDTTPKNQGARKQNRRGGNAKTDTDVNAATGAEAQTNASPSANADVNANTNAKGKHARQGRGHNAKNQSTTGNDNTGAAATGAGAVGAGANTQSPAPTAAQTNVQANTANTQATAGAGQGNNRLGRGKRLDPQTVQTIKSQHSNFRAQPRPDRVPAVTFNQNNRIQGAEQWQGPQYGVFRSYHPEMHDQGWYRSRYQRVELIGGGYYYWNNGYWFPAWGYERSAQYYPYDGPIYVGRNAEPPDRVIADVQAILQQAGYYRGEVDGLLGPLTREALTAYQADNGLYTTAAIDEPTLSSLGLG